jgi:hypothetical protein
MLYNYNNHSAWEEVNDTFYNRLHNINYYKVLHFISINLIF